MKRTFHQKMAASGTSGFSPDQGFNGSKNLQRKQLLWVTRVLDSTRLLTVYLQKYICLVHLTFLKRGTLTTFDGICNSIKPNTRRSNISYSIVMQTFLLAACVPRKKKSDNPTHAPKTFPLHHPPFPPLIWVFSSWVFRWLKRLLVHCHYYGTGAHCACTLAQFPEISFHIRLHD